MTAPAAHPPRTGRRYGEPVEVRRADESPAQFLWRGRLYLVREVLARWVEIAPWWRAEADGTDAAVGLPDDREREVWRVEAAAGARAATGVYDLSFDWAAGAWSLARVLD